MKLNDEQNMIFMNDERRLDAEKKLHEAVEKIHDCVAFGGNAGYYLTMLPVYLERLQKANENLIIVEATVEAEILSQERFHG